MVYFIITVILAFNIGIYIYYKKKIADRIFSLESEKVQITESYEKIIKDLKTNANTVAISKSTEDIIFTNLEIFEKSGNITDKNLSLSVVAKHLNTNPKYLSYIINKYKGKNFSNYINDLRVNFILEKFKNEPEYLNFQASKLAEEAGFISRTAFVTKFKTVTGKSPSEYKSEIKEM